MQRIIMATLKVVAALLAIGPSAIAYVAAFAVSAIWNATREGWGDGQR